MSVRYPSGSVLMKTKAREGEQGRETKQWGPQAGLSGPPAPRERRSVLTLGLITEHGAAAHSHHVYVRFGEIQAI